MNKKLGFPISLFVACGTSFVYLANYQEHVTVLPMVMTLLLILTAGGAIFSLVYFLYRADLFKSAISASRAGSRDSPMALQDLSILTRMQYAVDQHSIVSKTDVSGRIIYVNDLFEKVSGYKRNELIGQTHRVIKSDRHPDDFFDDMWQTISQGRIWHGEVCNQRKNGDYYWVESTIVPFVNDRGNPYEYISIRTDITKIKNYEVELIKAKEEAEQANSIKSRFLSNISHELRTPLNAILGFTQVLEMDESINPEGQTYIQQIHKAGNYLVSLFDDLLDMGCVENGTLSVNMSEFSVSDVLDECVNLSGVMARAQGIELRCEIDDCQSALVTADRKRLKQVVLNLLTNAIKYNREKGCIEIQCFRQADECLQIEISDTGVGMTSEEVKQIFQPFVRVGEKLEHIRGAGIGLALSKSIMQKMGGDILVQSVPGEGSTFTIRLPLAPAMTVSLLQQQV